MRRDDLIRLRHMLDAAREALSFIKGKSRSALEQDRMLALSLLKEIEIIGEAANNVSEEARNKHHEIPWLDIIGMRNHVIHVYFDVDLDILWDTVNKDLPPLADMLEGIISAEE